MSRIGYAMDLTLGVPNVEIALHPDVFIEAWLTQKKDRYKLLYWFPSLDSTVIYNDPLYVDMVLHERWLIWRDASRAFTLKTVDQKVFDVIESTILDSTVDDRAYYARAWWANPDMLNKLKDDPSREVINKLVDNPFLPDDVALYLVAKHKSPSIRISIAKWSNSLTVLNTIFNGTQSEQIRNAVLENPLFGGR